MSKKTKQNLVVGLYVKMLRKHGLAYRRSDMLADIRKVLGIQEEQKDVDKQFRDLVEYSKYCCQCDICRLHRARDFKSMHKTGKDMELIGKLRAEVERLQDFCRSCKLKTDAYNCDCAIKLLRRSTWLKYKRLQLLKGQE